MWQWKSLLLLSGLLSTVLSEPQAETSKPVTNETKSIEKLWRSHKFQEILPEIEDRLNSIGNSSAPSKVEREELVNLVVMYGKLNFYNHVQKTEVDLAVAYSAFTMAAAFGSPEAQYYLSLMHFYDLDDFLEKSWFRPTKVDKYWEASEYLKTRNERLSYLFLYSASMNGDERVANAMANKYIKGSGVDRDCPTAVAYMKDKAFQISSEEFVENPNFLQNYYLVKETFDLHVSSFGGNKYVKKNKENIDLIKMKAEKGDAQASLQLGYMYFYGFYGQPIDFEKAFHYFYMSMLKGDSTGEAFVGYMYYQGIGVEKNLKKAHEIFKGGELKKNFKCYNGLGLMYLRGDFLEKDLTRAYKLFKVAADAGHPSAQFNFASLLMFKWSDKIQDNMKLAVEYMTLAAHQGHIGAMYAMAVVQIEGYEHYHSCLLSEKLFKAVLERGNASKIVQQAFYNYLEDRHTVAAMYYLESAYLGYEAGLVNSAILLDKYDIFAERKSLAISFEEDGILSRLSFLLEFDKKALLSYAYEDLLSMNLDIDTNYTTESTTSIATSAALRLLRSASQEQNSFATVRLGDYYYYGRAGLPVNYSRAFYLYLSAQNMNKSNDFQAQAYLSTGFMSQFGIGTQRNLARARADYDKATRLGGSLTYIALFAKFLLELEYMFKIDLELLLQGKYYETFQRVLHNLDPLENTSSINQLTALTLVFLFLLVLRKRTANQMKHLLEHKEDNDH